MVISGEGSDEIFDGYLYFHKAPNEEELHHETCRKAREMDKRREGKPEEARAALSRSVRDNGLPETLPRRSECGKSSDIEKLKGYTEREWERMWSSLKREGLL
ncbi:hypothetical protein Syun_027410 [Stephania yunnanensis]|uniref:Asparagine synthetase domain-containing protein n=1 Tax=Stephania yunnanensis TaxID=152371 RepID=A0AAP0EPE7_9MAGN